MAVPKGFRNNINIHNQKIGPDRRQEILDGISAGGTFLPKSVLEEDMDQAFIEFLKKDERMIISIDGKKVPVIFLTIQRWTEFTKTWEFTDEFKNIEMPFITVVRRPDIQQGQNQAGLWNIPGNRTYTYMKVPTWDGIRHGVDLYKIPQPTSVDITYEVRLFTNRMKDLNKFNRKIQKAFQSRQCYINANGHPMPLHLENIGDESNIDDFENRRFYVQSFEIKLIGYVMDSEDFEVVPTINRAIATLEVEDKLIPVSGVGFETIKKENEAFYNFIWKPNAPNTFTFTSKYNISFSQLVNIENLTRIKIKVNNIVVFDGLVLNGVVIFNANDVIEIKVYKNQLTTGKFTLIGNTIS
jgi:hypothetical protein